MGHTEVTSQYSHPRIQAARAQSSALRRLVPLYRGIAGEERRSQTKPSQAATLEYWAWNHDTQNYTEGHYFWSTFFFWEANAEKNRWQYFYITSKRKTDRRSISFSISKIEVGEGGVFLRKPGLFPSPPAINDIPQAKQWAPPSSLRCHSKWFCSSVLLYQPLVHHLN